MDMTPCTILQNVNVSAAFPLVVFQQACKFQFFFLTAPMSETQLQSVSGLSLCNFHCCCLIFLLHFFVNCKDASIEFVLPFRVLKDKTQEPMVRHEVM